MTIDDPPRPHEIASQISGVISLARLYHLQLLRRVRKYEISVWGRRGEHAETELVRRFATIVRLRVHEEVYVGVYLSFVVTVAATSHDGIRFHSTQVAFFVVLYFGSCT